MSARTIILVGADGHICVVGDASLAAGTQWLGFVDDDPRRHGQQRLIAPGAMGRAGAAVMAVLLAVMANCTAGVIVGVPARPLHTTGGST